MTALSVAGTTSPSSSEVTRTCSKCCTACQKFFLPEVLLALEAPCSHCVTVINTETLLQHLTGYHLIGYIAHRVYHLTRYTTILQGIQLTGYLTGYIPSPVDYVKRSHVPGGFPPFPSVQTNCRSKRKDPAESDLQIIFDRFRREEMRFEWSERERERERCLKLGKIFQLAFWVGVKRARGDRSGEQAILIAWTTHVSHMTSTTAFNG